MAPVLAAEDLLRFERVAELSRGGQRARLYASPLGGAAYQLHRFVVERSLSGLRRCGFLDAGLVFASEVRPSMEDRTLYTLEWRQFQPEIGCSPLILACLGCASELARLRDAAHAPEWSGESAELSEREAEVQQLASDIVELLVGAGADVSGADLGPRGDTPLHVAARVGARELLSTIIRLGADVAKYNNDGSTPEVLAKRAKHPVCAQILQAATVARTENQAAEAHREAEREVAERERRKKDLQRRKVREKKRIKEEKQLAAVAVEQTRDSGGDDVATTRRKVTISGSKPNGSSGEESDGKARRRGEDHGSRAAYGGAWAALEKSYDVDGPPMDEADPEAEDWDVEKWGEYEDWGDDWVQGEGDEGDEVRRKPNDEAPSSDEDDAFEDEDEVRQHVQRLRAEKDGARHLLYDIAAEREERSQAAELLGRQAARLGERAARLEEREARAKTGDSTAADDTAAESEVSVWWEERATARARAVWELERSLGEQHRAQESEVAALEKEFRSAQRRTKGLEAHFDRFYEADSAKELLDRVSIQGRCARLAREVQTMTEAPDLLPRVASRLPPLLEEDGRSLLRPHQLLAAVEAHRRIQLTRQEHERSLDELIDLCNRQLAVKGEELREAVNAELAQLMASQGGEEVEHDREAWAELAGAVERAQRSLEKPQDRPGASAGRRS